MELPVFNTDALSSLTQKIESSFKKPNPGASKPITKTKDQSVAKGKNTNGSLSLVNNEKESKGKKRLRNGHLKDQRSEPLQANRTNRGGEHTAAPVKSFTKSANPKSDRIKVSGVSVPTKSAGNLAKPVLQRPNLEHKGRRIPISNDSGRNGTNSLHQLSSKGSKSIEYLKNEVFALGGTEEDLALVEEVESGSEVEGTSSKITHGLLKHDIQRFVKDLGIQKAGVLEEDTTSDEGEEGEQGNEEDLSNPNEIVIQPRKLTDRKAHDPARGASYLVFEPLSEWHAAQLPSIPNPSHPSSGAADEIFGRIHEHAKHLLEENNHQYALQNRSSSSAHQFYSTIMSSGTLSDKISALTLSVQESPVHNMKALETLIGLAKKRSRTQAVEVLGALKDLFGQGSLLPSDRRLRAFKAQPGLSSISTKTYKNWEPGQSLPPPLEKGHLISWAYEDWLKTTYFEILKILETWCNDEIAFARGKAVDYVYELLRDKPEQEANLLRLLVNKLGDSDKKIASKTSYNIVQLETSHPLMKPTIIDAIESDVLFRPGQSMHAKYYAVITLNQTVLSGKEEAVARKALDIYFSLFITLLAKPEPSKPSLSSANGVTYNKKGEKQGGGGAAGKKAQKKLEKQAKNFTVDEELREKMLSAVLTGVNRAIPYTKADDEFFEKHLDTLFRVTHSSNLNTSIQALMLIQQLCGSHPAASDRFYRTLYESLLDPRLLTSSKHAMYLNLLYRALRADLKVKRVQAFAKRLLQVVAMHQPPFVCGVIYLLRELEGVFTNLQAFVDQPEEEDSDDEEDFRDVGEDGEMERPARAIAIQTAKLKGTPRYDGRKREPEYSNAERSCLWELDPFLKHFHPSVGLFASKLMNHAPMPEKPDLASHSLIHFLDRFVYRNPKKAAAGLRGASIMQPLAGGDASALLVSAQGKKGMLAPVNTEAFWRMESNKVNPDEVFFHRYFNTMGRGKGKKADKKEKTAQGSEADDGEDEEEIWKALVHSRPQLEASESGDDVDMDDLESAIGGSNGGISGDEADDSEGVVIDSGDGDDESMDFDDDDEALLGSDDEVPSDLDGPFKNELQFVTGMKNGGPVPEKPWEKRRRLKNLPTFASAEDYAAMLAGSDQEET